MANDDLNIANNAINNARGKMINNEFKRDRSNIVSSVAAEVARMFKPFLKEIRETAQVDKSDLLNALSQITVEGTPSNVTVPEIKVPTINVPEPRVHVTVPPVRVPDVVMPDEMNIRGFVGLMGVDLNNPLPVQLRDENGNIVNLLENITAIGGGGGGGSRGTVKIINDSGSPIPITGTISATLAADTGSGEIGSDTLRMVQATDAISSVNVVDAFGSTSATGIFNADNRIRCSIETGGTGLTDAELRASSVPVAQASGANWSTEATGGTIDTVTTVATVTDITNSVAVIIEDGDGATRTTFPIEGTLTGITNDVSIDDGGNTITVDGSVTATGGGYLTDTELRASTLDVKQVSGAISSVSVIGTPTVRPIQVRGSLATAYTSTTTGIETSLLAGVASEYHDMIWMKGANQSDAAVTLDIRGSLAGPVIDTLVIPANSTAGISTSVPYPQADLDASWTIQNIGTDVSNTDVDVTALFSKEV